MSAENAVRRLGRGSRVYGWWALLPMAALAMSGCGGNQGAPTKVEGTAPAIITQPANAVVPLGASAAVSVTATGSGPLSYQWSENGNALSGATSATLTTATLQMSDMGDKFSVTVSNAYGSVTSNVATITIGPRSPAQRDMRFKHVQIASNLTDTLHTNIGATVPGDSIFASASDDLGAPVSVGNQSCGTIDNSTTCGWLLDEYAAPTGVPGFDTAYSVHLLVNLSKDLASLGGNSVVTSLDEQAEPGMSTYIFADSVETDPTVTGGFTLKRTQVTDTTLAAAVSAMAAQGVVITAASANSNGGIDLVGYSWTGDAGTIYEAQAVLTTYEGVGPQALSLAQEGYILTAVGTADNNQVLLVGTKVHGDSLPRGLVFNGPQGGGGTFTPSQIIVGNTFGNDAGNNPNLPGHGTVIAQ